MLTGVIPGALPLAQAGPRHQSLPQGDGLVVRNEIPPLTERRLELVEGEIVPNDLVFVR